MKSYNEFALVVRDLVKIVGGHEMRGSTAIVDEIDNKNRTAQVRVVSGQDRERSFTANGSDLLIVGREAGGYGDGPERLTGSGIARYTIYTTDEDGYGSEEIDVDAINSSVAKLLAREILKADYIDGLKITGCEERFGLYL